MKKRKKRLLPQLVAMAFGLAIAVQGGTGWQGIIPLHSIRADVEKLLGPPEGECRCIYNWGNQKVRVQYAQGPCKGEQLGWNVSADTVLLISVKPLKVQPANTLGVAERGFVKKYDSASSLRLIDIENGIRYSFGVTYLSGPAQYLIEDVAYIPSASDNYLRCPGFPHDDGGIGKYEAFDLISDWTQSSLAAHMDNFAVGINGRKSQIAYIIAYAGKIAHKGEASKRAASARRYLIDRRKIPGTRIVALDGGFRENPQLELYLIAADAPPPTPEPTVPLSNVTFLVTKD